MRAQTNLPALAIALLVVTTTAGLGVMIAHGAFADTDRDPVERHAAVALAERLVSPASPLTTRANVFNRSRLTNLSDARLSAQFPVVGDRDVRIRLGDRTILATGTPTGGTTIRRIALVRTAQVRGYRPAFVAGNATTLPRRTDAVTLSITPPNGTTVRTVAANGRVLLRNTSGLVGTFSVAVSRFETTRLSFGATGPLPDGSVRVQYVPARTTKAVLAVTVDD
jgi:hypothetical protein